MHDLKTLIIKNGEKDFYWVKFKTIYLLTYVMSELKPKQMFTQVQGKVKISTKSMNSNINVNGTTNSTKHVIIDKNTDFAAKVVPGGLHIL